jgi:hypothetical protein
LITHKKRFSARYNHETIALGFSLTEEAIEDNLYDSLSSRYTKALARAMAYTKQTKAAAILNNGFSTAFPGGDGEPLFSTAHPLVSGGVNSNEPSTPADLNETSLEAAVIQIAAWTDERGLLIAAKPRKLIVPPALQFVATRLLETELRVGTADNDINAIKNNGSIPEGYRVNNYLTDDDAWFLCTDVPNGLKHFIVLPWLTPWTGILIPETFVTKLVSVIPLDSRIRLECSLRLERKKYRRGGLVPPFFLVYFAV